MVQTVLVGLVSGVAGALLYLSPLGGTLLAFPLFILCGLPIAIAGLGWGMLSASIATATAGVLAVIAVSGAGAVVYLALFGGPILWMCRLTLLSRQAEQDVEWYPIGRILFQGAIAAAIGVIVVGFIIGYDPATLTEEIATALVAWFAQAPDVSAPPTLNEVEPFVRFNVLAMPFTLSAIVVVVLVFNMWLGARIAEASGRMRRPRERLWTASLPREAAIVFGAAVLASLLPGAIGHAAGAFAGAFGGALALIGLAVLHATTVGNDLRTLILVAVYVLIILFGIPILLLAVLGLAETFLHFRARRLRGASKNE